MDGILDDRKALKDSLYPANWLSQGTVYRSDFGILGMAGTGYGHCHDINNRYA